MTIDFSGPDGLVPAIVQDARTGRVLMLGYMNREAYERTAREKFVTFWSRSRRELWRKGDTSGNRLALVSLHADCDGDALLVRAVPSGPVCHNGTATCFADDPGTEGNVLRSLAGVIADRHRERPDGSYTASLFAKGTGAIAQKVGEEATETVVAALSQGKERLIAESADLLYHLLVLLADRGVSLEEVEEELRRRSQ